MPKVKPQKKVENLLRKRRVVTINDLCEVIGSSSRMTVFRRLRQIDYVTSYTHAGRYYTLYDIARFDSDGLWFYYVLVLSFLYCSFLFEYFLWG